ncbi:MAG: hypothetical protein WCO69_03585 [Candidatus Omnitrophota bacterium]
MDNKKIVEVFDHLSPILADRVGGPVYLVKVSGARWSYVAGHVPSELPFVEPQKVLLFDEWAVLYYPQAGHHIDPEDIRRMFLEAREDEP